MTENPIRDAIQRGDQRERGHPLHEGHARAADVRLLARAPSRRSTRSARRTRRSTSCPTRASARSSRRSRTGRRSRSCSSSGELVGGCDIVTEMYESGELAADARRRAAAGRAGSRRPPPRPTPAAARRCRSRTGSPSGRRSPAARALRAAGARRGTPGARAGRRPRSRPAAARAPRRRAAAGAPSRRRSGAGRRACVRAPPPTRDPARASPEPVSNSDDRSIVVSSSPPPVVTSASVPLRKRSRGPAGIPRGIATRIVRCVTRAARPAQRGADADRAAAAHDPRPAQAAQRREAQPARDAQADLDACHGQRAGVVGVEDLGRGGGVRDDRPARQRVGAAPAADEGVAEAHRLGAPAHRDAQAHVGALADG